MGEASPRTRTGSRRRCNGGLPANGRPRPPFVHSHRSAWRCLSRVEALRRCGARTPLPSSPGGRRHALTTRMWLVAPALAFDGIQIELVGCRLPEGQTSVAMGGQSFIVTPPWPSSRIAQVAAPWHRPRCRRPARPAPRTDSDHLVLAGVALAGGALALIVPTGTPWYGIWWCSHHAVSWPIKPP